MNNLGVNSGLQSFDEGGVCGLAENFEMFLQPGNISTGNLEKKLNRSI